MYKYFGLNPIDLERDIGLGQYYCYLAVALDEQELDHYHDYIMAGGDPKKFKWQSPDHAGTRSVGAETGPREFHLDNVLAQAGEQGSEIDFANATGRTLYYVTPSGIYMNKDGQQVAESFVKDDPNSFIVSLSEEPSEK